MAESIRILTVVVHHPRPPITWDFNPELNEIPLLLTAAMRFNFLKEELLREGGLDVQTKQIYKDESVDDNKDRYRTDPGMQLLLLLYIYIYCI